MKQSRKTYRKREESAGAPMRAATGVVTRLELAESFPSGSSSTKEYAAVAIANSYIGEEVECHATLIGGFSMHTLVAGAGEPLVFVHGLLGTASSWLPTMRQLSRSARVYAVDALGMGLSDRVAGLDVSLHASACRLRDWMDLEALDQVDMVATSHGGAVAMCFAALFPDRVRSLVLHAPANPFCEQSRPQIRFFSSTRLGRQLAHILPIAPRWLHNVALTRMYGRPELVREGSLEEYVRSLRVPGTVDYVLAVLQNWVSDMAALIPLLPRLRRLPVLLLWGAHDRAVSLASATRLRAILRAPLEILPEVGHLPFEEAPEIFAARILTFLRESAAGRQPLRSA
jgi:pimeloyl-ACP methyl ester carboxylesterase